METNLENEIMPTLAYVLVFIFCIIMAELISRLFLKDEVDDE